jgi:pimeloyl-ACP methyl ester carboxylesterase
MATFVLIHGAWHGSWCWQDIVPTLEKSHKILLIDLPGRNYSQPGDFKEIDLSAYVSHVIEALKDISGDIILVGHSMAGMVITQVAEQIPERLSALVYVAAFMPKHQESLFDITRQADGPGISTEFIANQPDNYIDLKKSARTQSLLLNMVPDALAEVTMQKLNKEPFMAFVEKSNIPTMAFHHIPQFYIKCLQDQAILPAFQNTMIAKLNNPTVYELNADHSPYLSEPVGLVELLRAIIKRIAEEK